ncbi:LamG domain-containing protein, partial [bacterium]|nr:LamG domain-containing protein [bacterium]
MKKIFTFAIVGLVLIAWNGGVGAYAAPVISFVEPTPVDGETIYDTSVEIEVSITEAALVDVTFNWDGTDYSLYDDSLVLMFNFDNVVALGEDYENHPEYGVADLSGKENHGILSATPGIPQWVAGMYGGAFDFTGNGSTSGQSVLVPHNINGSLDPGSGDFAIAVWILTRDDIDGDILRKGSTNTTTEPKMWYKLEHSPSPSNNRLSLNFNTDGTDATVTSAAAYNDYQWHFVVAQRKGNQAELWIDGVLDGSAAVSGSISNAADLAVGSKDTQNDDFLNSTLDEVRIYMRSFGQDEIKELYYSNLSKYAADGWTLYVNQSNLSDETTYTYQ